MYPDRFPVHHSGPGVFAWFSMILFALLLVGLIAAIVTRWAGPRPLTVGPAARPAQDHADALQVLRMRYARGEVDRESFLQATDDLGGLPPPT